MATDPFPHVPGDLGLPGVGHTLAFVRDAQRLMLELRSRHGRVFKVKILGDPGIVFATPDAAKTVFLDRDQVFSSELGWKPTIGVLFRRGLMLRDWDDHRFHRRIMQAAFRKDALIGYMDLMNPVIERRAAEWGELGTMDFYRSVKALALDIAAEAFIGAPLGDEADALNQAFMDAVTAAITPVRKDWPGTTYHRGLEGRRQLVEYFGSRVPVLRAASERQELFSRLCHATDEDGNTLTDDEIVDHMIFLLLAAHDTTTSTLSVMMWEMARQPVWQERLRDEVRDLGEAALSFEGSKRLTQVDWVFKEANRLVPPVPFSPRVAVADTEVDGWRVPADAGITVASMLIHRDPEWWTNPHDFDPERFSDERAEHKQHSHVYVPFAGGAHTCLGNHFAQLMAKAILTQVLPRYRFSPGRGTRVEFQTVPIPKPRRNLPLEVSAA